jgi:hypothetical protein
MGLNERATGAAGLRWFGGRLGLLTVRRGERRPEVTSAARAHPELVGRPRHARSWIAEVHLGAAALTSDVQVELTHARDSTLVACPH